MVDFKIITKIEIIGSINQKVIDLLTDDLLFKPFN